MLVIHPIPYKEFELKIKGLNKLCEEESFSSSSQVRPQVDTKLGQQRDMNITEVRMLRSTCGKTTKHTIREVKICDSVEVAPIKDTLRENSLW